MTAPGSFAPDHGFLSKWPLEAARLLRVVHKLSFARDIPAIAAIACAAARDLTRADGVTFVTRESNDCYFAEEDATGPLWKGQRIPQETCISGWVMTHNTPVVIPDVCNDSRVTLESYRNTFVKSLAMVPVGNPQPLAAIGAYWATEHHATDYEVEALVLLADSAALALTNVGLYQELMAVADRERRARIVAETATSEKDEFLALVAHELRQPLHASLAALRMMETRASRQAGAQARSVVERQVTYMNRLVEDLLDAARIVRGHIELNLERSDLRGILQRVVEALQPLIAEREHVLEVLMPPHAVMARSDTARLEQVLTNLLTNATKYTHFGGVITLALASHHGQATIRVTDTGRGIEPAVLPRIFDLFTRGASDVGWLGVGLAVARKLVGLHRGTIDARSAGAGLGSEFVVSLPLAEPVVGARAD